MLEIGSRVRRGAPRRRPGLPPAAAPRRLRLHRLRGVPHGLLRLRRARADRELALLIEVHIILEESH